MATTACVLSAPAVHDGLFGAWLGGLGAEEAVEATLMRGSMLFGGNLSRAQALALAESQYVLFEALSSLFLRRPRYFCEQTTHMPVAREARLGLVHRFFAIEPAAMAMLVPRKIAPKTRRDMGEIADDCGLPISVCMRQFDNLLEVHTQLSDAFAAAATQHRPPEEAAAVAQFAVASVREALLLPVGLARSYVCILFLNHHRIAVPPGTSFDAAMRCAAILLCHWTAGTISFTLDARISHASRDALASLDTLGTEDALRARVPGISRKNLPSVHALLVASLQIGAGLAHARGVASLLSDIQVRVARAASAAKAGAASAIVRDPQGGVLAAALALLPQSSPSLRALTSAIALCAECLPA